MKSCLDTSTVGFDVGVTQLIQIAEAAGYDAVEFSIEAAAQYISQHSTKDFLDLVNSSPVTLGQFSCGFGIPSNLYCSERDFDQLMPRWKNNCRLAHQIGCTQASLTLERVPLDNPPVTTFDYLVMRLGEILKVAREFGIRVALETVDADFMDMQVAIVSEFEQGEVGILADANAMFLNGDAEAIIRKIPAGRLFWVHVSDRVRNGAHRCLPGKGNIPLAHIVEECRRNGYESYYSLEVYGDPALEHMTSLQRAIAGKQAFDSIGGR